MNIILVGGVSCAGKSTYCKNQANLVAESAGIEHRPFVLHLGDFFRGFFGPKFFVNLDTPSAPHVTNPWVKNLVTKAIEHAYTYNRDLYIDGFPRTAEQVQWLVNSCIGNNHPYNAKFNFRFLFPDEDVLAERVRQRTKNPEEDLVLLQTRMERDAAKVIEVQKALSRYLNTGNYTNITMEEVNA